MYILLLFFIVVILILLGFSRNNKRSLKISSVVSGNSKSTTPVRKDNQSTLLIDTHLAREITISSTIKESVTKKDAPDQDWDAYWKIFNRGFTLYQHYKWYSKAKKEFLKIYSWTHTSEAYYSHLLVVYQSILDKLIKQKKHYKAILEMQDMFQKCHNTTLSDVTKFNNLIDTMRLKNQGFKLQKMPMPNDNESEFVFNPLLIDFVSYIKKSKESFAPPQSDSFFSNLLKHNFILPAQLPQIVFSDSQLVIHPNDNPAKCNHSILLLSESILHKGYLASSVENNLYLYGPNLKLISTKNLSSVGAIHATLSSLAVSPYLDIAAINVGDKLYLLDSSLEIISIFKLPAHNQQENKKHYDELGIKPGATNTEINKAFIEQIQKNFALKQYKDPFAEPKLHKLIQAYTFLTDQDISCAFPNIENSESWLKTLYGHILKQKQVISPEDMPIGGDTVCSAQFSEDSSEIFLCCSSGKIYRLNLTGIASVIYTLPDNLLIPSSTSPPILFIMQKGDYLNILTPEHLLTVVGNSTINIMEVNPKNIMWFRDGFIIKEDLSTLAIYYNSGELFDRLKMQDPIMLYAYENNHLFIETPSKIYAFRLYIN
ncbi:MAG: hypothetical protein A2Y40_10600 [Candidatus Margulisbacteria bacterium GWF2_35_9]|nr:MAG: hypothetical protein A2Y40_10600 [Candidatus Margulisbacteria bacterium GWF2_35_9]